MGFQTAAAVLVLSVAFGVVMLVQGSTVTTSGTGGIPCPPGPNCLDVKSECSGNASGDCVCIKNFLEQNRDGNLDCYKANTRWGRGVNDPTYKNFDLLPQNVYKFQLPCRILFSHTTSQLKARGEGVVGTCECKTYSWNYKFEGKIYVGGVELTCDVNRTKPAAFTDAFTTVITGLANNGVYSFTEYGSQIFMDPSPAVNVQAEINEPGIYYGSQYDNSQNQVVLNMWACGVRVVFTPYDIAKGKNQDYLAGFSVAINCANQPDFLSQDKVMGTGPEDFGGPPFESPLLPGLDIPTSYKYRALTSMIPQTQPNPNPQCSAGAAAVALCDTAAKRSLTQTRCNFIFHYPHFIKCADPTTNGAVIMQLYNTCVRSICDDGESCTLFTTAMLAATVGCPPKATTAITEYNLHNGGAWCP